MVYNNSLENICAYFGKHRENICHKQTLKKRLSQNTLRWPLLFHSKLKSFGFFSKDEFISLLLKISLFFLLP